VVAIKSNNYDELLRTMNRCGNMVYYGEEWLEMSSLLEIWLSMSPYVACHSMPSVSSDGMRGAAALARPA
jgi:hypothetical protein